MRIDEDGLRPKRREPRVRRSCVVLLWASILIQTAPATAAGPDCARVRPHPLPDADTCLRARLGGTHAARGEAARTALFSQAEERIKAGAFDEAEGALQCAAAQRAAGQDWRADYEWIRREGVLAYHRERIDSALDHFECALQLATRHDDRAAMAKQSKNIGSALRRLGDYQGALRALQRSLWLQRNGAGSEVGAALNNLADLHREIGDFRQAVRYYREALAALRREGRADEVPHVLESLGAIQLERGDPAEAARTLEAALQAFRRANNPRHQLQAHMLLAQAALAGGDLTRARVQVGSGLVLAQARALPVPPDFHVVAARVDRIGGNTRAATARLRAALAQAPEAGSDRAALLQELATTLEQDGRAADALALLREAAALERQDLQARTDRQFGWLRARFQAVESERTISALRQRTLTLWLIAASALAALLGVGLLFVRHRQRARLADAENRARTEETLARYRRETDALAEDRDLLQALLDSRDSAVCLLDAEGLVLAVNRPACAMLEAERVALVGHPLQARLDPADARTLTAALECMEDALEQAFAFAPRGGDAPLRARLAQWEHSDGLILLTLDPPSSAAASPSPVHGDASPHEEGKARMEFRQALVELMLAVLDAWERSTGTSRIEFAERSRVWRVNIDDGRLRARALERYLAVSKLPEHPRWRDVVRSAYYVLGQCELDPATRERLQARVDGLLAYTRRRALV